MNKNNPFNVNGQPPLVRKGSHAIVNHSIHRLSLLCLGILLSYLLSSALLSPCAFSQLSPLSQTIQINTRLNRFVGQPTWLLIIRDLDRGENIPYLFDIYRENNFWVAFTHGRNYLITASILTFAPYGNQCCRTKKIHNFCQLESRGHIMRGRSLIVTLTGNLTPRPGSYTCHVQSFANTTFTIVRPDDESL